MHSLTISFYEFGQFLQIVLWIFLPLFVIVLLVTTYIHHRKKTRESGLFIGDEGLLLAAEVNGGEEGRSAAHVAEMGQPEGDNLYKALIWMKQKFEDYREQTDRRIGTLKEEADDKSGAVQQLQEELTQANEKITELTGKLESNMSLLMNIHKELDRSLNPEPTPATPEAANGGLSSGE